MPGGDADQNEASNAPADERARANGNETESDAKPPTSATSNRAGSQQPTSDGGLSLSRPIVVVELADDQIVGLIGDALEAAGERLQTLCGEIAESKVREAFWRRDCEMRRRSRRP